MRQRKCGALLQKQYKKFTLHYLQHFKKQSKIALATPTKKESSSSSTKSKTKGLSKKELDLLEYLKDDPNMRQIVLQKNS